MQTSISIFSKITDTESTKTIPVDLFLDNIRSGTWQDIVLPIRAIKDKEQRSAKKKQVPYVTLSGIFPERKDSACKQHSGILGVDIDDLGADTEKIKQLLSNDAYVYAIFTSISGTGLCVLFRINGDKHREAFAGIATYLIQKYQIVVDPSGVNPSRARFVSFDPYLYQNNKALAFKQYPPKERKRKEPAAVFVADEFSALIQRMVEAGIDCCENYSDWVRVGFALADKLGESGRDYFHSLSSISGKYDYETCEKQYSHCLKGSASQKRATIGTIYWYAKQAGIDISSPTTIKIASATASLKKSGLSIDAIVSNLEQFEGIEPEVSRPIVEEAYNSNAQFSAEESTIEAVRSWLRLNFNFKRNNITGRIEVDGRALEDEDKNTIFLEAKIIFKELNYDLFERILYSNYIPSYNPFMAYYEQHKNTPYDNEIERLLGTITCDNSDKLQYFGKKWLVGIAASIHGTHSPLMLVFAGNILNIGKTEFFRRLLPDELRHYYAESKLDAGKDDEILMTQKLIVMDDEMGGKSKRDARRLKELTSKQTFSLRKPYGRTNVDINRIAVLCGTSNDLELLNDPTGNRRIIPVEVTAIDFETCNQIDRRALFIQLFRLYKEGFQWTLTQADIERLNSGSEQFQEYSLEYELINKYFEPGESMTMTATEVKVELEIKSTQKLNIKKIGQELKRMGFRKQLQRIKHGYSTKQVYHLNYRQSEAWQPPEKANFW